MSADRLVPIDPPRAAIRTAAIEAGVSENQARAVWDAVVETVSVRQDRDVLTRREGETLAYLIERAERDGPPATLTEIAETVLGNRTLKPNVSRYLSALERKGYITRASVGGDRAGGESPYRIAILRDAEGHTFTP